MNRIIFKDNATLNDYSMNCANYYAGTSLLDFVAADDYLFVGSYLPFNHLFFKMSVVSTESSVISASLWDGTAWNAAVDVIDETSLAGASLGQSGYVSWVPSKEYGWAKDDTVDGNGTEKVTGLGGVTIYDRFWIRFDFSADLTALTAFSWIGNLFANDNDLGTEYPDLVSSAVLTAFESGKTDWEEQHVRAAELLVADLVDRRIIFNSGQILDRREFRSAAVSKVAELIFAGLGNDVLEDKNEAGKEYIRRMALKHQAIDKDINARIETQEIDYPQARLFR